MESTANKQTAGFLSNKVKGVAMEVIAYLFVAMFTYTATAKLIDMEKFQRFLTELEHFQSIGHYLAWAIPITEIIIAILLLIPSLKLAGLYSALALMVTFTTYLIYMKLSFEHVPCHCGGSINNLSWKEHIWFNLIFIFLAILACYLSPKKQPINQRKNYN